MKSLLVDLKEKSYKILIGKGLLNKTGELLKEVYKEKRLFIISDEQIWALYGEELKNSLKNAGYEPEQILLPPGEGSKNIKCFEEICEKLAALGAGRSHMLIAFGGGVIGDISGFIAATYMRGLPYMQIPTTLLAQVDSSVGGKTALNLSRGKNLIGAFWQPKMVIADTGLLATLNKREFAGGMAEIIKYAAIASDDLFKGLIQHEGSINGYKQLESSLEDIIARCCQIKSGIVARDEFDLKERMLLNFGHTFGHAIEQKGGYKEYIHGEAVAMGMVIAAEIGEAMGLTCSGTANALKRVLEKYALPAVSPYNLNELLPALFLDKKNTANYFNLILLKKIGQSFIYSIKTAEIQKLIGGG